jgi:hypothetical protein
MTIDKDDRIEGGSPRHALERMFRASTRVLWMKFRQMTVAASPRARPKPTIPIIVKDKTSFYWQIVLAGARQAGWDLGVNVIELGTERIRYQWPDPHSCERRRFDPSGGRHRACTVWSARQAGR